MSYQWKIGELAVCVIPFPRFLTIGGIYTVSDVFTDNSDEFEDYSPHVPRGNQNLKLYGVGIPEGRSRRHYWKATRFRPLHGSDIRKLEEKYPEYVIKTNEVEG